MPRTSAVDWPDLVVSSSATSDRILRAVDTGKLRPLAVPFYSPDLESAAADIVRRNVWRIVGTLVPGGMLSYRTAIEGKPADDGSVFVVAAKRYERDLPGLRIRAVKGPGPFAADTLFVEGLFQASRARAMLDALRPSRARGGVARGLRSTELEVVLDRQRDRGGLAALTTLLENSRRIADTLHATAEFEALERLIHARLGTPPVGNTIQAPDLAAMSSAAGPFAGALSMPAGAIPTGAPTVARPAASRGSDPLVRAGAGAVYDVGRVRVFDTLYAELQQWTPVPRPSSATTVTAFATVGFFDAYFANVIDDNAITLDAARAAVFEQQGIGGDLSGTRTTSASELLGAFAVVGNRATMGHGVRREPSYAAFENTLRSVHRRMTVARPDFDPGALRRTAPGVTRPDGAPAMNPDHIGSTLRYGYDLVRSLASPFQRGVAMLCVLLEVEPFVGANARLAGAMMNAELLSGNETRVIIPPVFVPELAGALRHLRVNHDAVALLRAIDFAQRWVASISWSRYDRAESSMRATRAFESAGAGVHLELPEFSVR